MTILFGHAEGNDGNGIINHLIKLVNMDLPIGLWSRVKRALRDLQAEAQLYGPVRERVLKEYCTSETGEGGKQFFKFPLPDDEKFAGFEKEWAELLNTKLEITYAPIEYLDIIDKTPDEVKKKLIVSNSDFAVLDFLNEVYEAEKKVETPDTSAGENNKGDINPPAGK